MKGHKEVVRLLEAAAAGLTNIAFLSEEVLVTSRKLLLRGIFSSCREVQRQTKVRESPAGGRAHIRFIAICWKYFKISRISLCSLCYVARSGKLIPCCSVGGASQP